ncbi:hypothetical protein Cpin_2643 [Chitinophaga pinensis DSM 2588]|uniref:Uncharacterized protein n=1 Tax=Chitinophaga pinensis (strain ATCC 43595 / DSM 2588 / LMG 13176 / NBRC 15968 / NCIMB 11800 / UQM 2034) TaxID=485918 RepID=A0A979GVU2_CHIPD|nr:hypothetical protein Cpin_2643 [Chitinophaga pinensis DSM 2588]
MLHTRRIGRLDHLYPMIYNLLYYLIVAMQGVIVTLHKFFDSMDFNTI